MTEVWDGDQIARHELQQKIDHGLSCKRNPGYSLAGCVWVANRFFATTFQFEPYTSVLLSSGEKVIILSQDIGVRSGILGGDTCEITVDIPTFELGYEIFVPPNVPSGISWLPEHVYAELVHIAVDRIRGLRSESDLFLQQRIALKNILYTIADVYHPLFSEFESENIVQGLFIRAKSFIWNGFRYAIRLLEDSGGWDYEFEIYLIDGDHLRLVYTYEEPEYMSSYLFSEILKQWKKECDPTGGELIIETIDKFLNFPTFDDVWHAVRSCTNGMAIITLPSGAMLQVEASEMPMPEEDYLCRCLRVTSFPRDAIERPFIYLSGQNIPQGEVVYLDPSMVGEYSGLGAGYNGRLAILPRNLALIILAQIEDGGPEVWDSLLQL